MSDGAGIAAASMRTQAAQLELVSANLANVSTPGYKRQLAAPATPFADLLKPDSTGLRSTPGIDMRSGAMRNTGHALDLAIEGEAFFELQLGGASLYTRQGNFILDPQGRLQAPDGAVLQGVAGDIRLEGAQPRIDAQGRVFEGDTQVGQLKLVRFDQAARLRSLDGVRFAQGGAEIASSGGESARSTVRQGFLEASNVLPADEMIKLMQATRQFESGQRVILWFGDMHDQVRQRLGEF